MIRIFFVYLPDFTNKLVLTQKAKKMKARDENQLAMWIVLLTFLKNNPEFTNSMEAFAALMVTFGDQIDQLMLIMKALGYDTSNLTTEKRMAKESLVIKMSRLRAMIKAYARKSNDNSLLLAMKGSPTSLRRMKDLDFLVKANNIYDAAIGLGKALEPYGGKNDFLEECLKVKKDFNDSIPKTRTGIADHKHSNEELEATMVAGRTTLAEMDGLVEIEQFTQPLMFSDYWNRHKVIEAGHRFLSVQFHVVNDATGEAMDGVAIRFWQKGGELKEITTKKSSEKGGCNVKGLFTAEYEFEATYLGFIKYSGSFIYHEGKKIDVVIKMKKMC